MVGQAKKRDFGRMDFLYASSLPSAGWNEHGVTYRIKDSKNPLYEDVSRDG